MLDDAGPGATKAPSRGTDAAIEIDGRHYVRKHPADLAAKRVFDVVFAAVGLIAALPLLAVIAVLIKLDSRGPVFYRQKRVGRFRKHFLIWKFRKMYEDLPTQGPSLTRRYDFRLTRLGRVLERTKLDELPQLINVLFGEMSIIGPRPEVPKFVEHYPDAWQTVLSVKPGIFGPNQLRNRNESELYPAGCKDVERFYVDHILPDKLEIDAEYARLSRCSGDLWLMVQCLVAATVGAITWQTVISQRLRIVNFSVLCGAGIAGTASAQLMTGNPLFTPVAIHALLIAAIVKPASLLLLRVPSSLPLSATQDDFMRAMWCAMGSTSLMVIGLLTFGHGELNGLALSLDGLFFLGFMLLYKLLLHSGYVTFRAQEDRVLARRMVRATVTLSALSVMAMVALRHGPAAWTHPGTLYPVLLLLASVIRPVLMVLMRAPRQREHAFEWAAAEWPLLLAVSLIGSCMMAVGARMLGQPTVALGDLLLDASLFAGLSSGYALWQGARLRKRTAASNGNGASAGKPRERLLIAGSGIELGAFVAALSGLSERDYEIIGLLGPNMRDRGGEVGGRRVVGEFLDLSEILRNGSVDRLVILPGGIEPASLAHLKDAAAERGCPVVTLPLLSGIRSATANGNSDGDHALSTARPG